MGDTISAGRWERINHENSVTAVDLAWLARRSDTACANVLRIYFRFNGGVEAFVVLRAKSRMTY